MLGAIKDAIRKNLDDRVPFIEFPCPGIATIDELESPRIIKSHLPLQLLPATVLGSPHVKVIYVTRNPRDVAVSLYHFMDMLTQVSGAMVERDLGWKRMSWKRPCLGKVRLQILS